MRRWGGALAGCGLLLAAACGGGGDAGGGAAEDAPPGGYKTFGGGAPGGTLIVLWEGEPDDLNPLTFDSSPAYNVVHLLFRALARRDSTLSGYTPDLLERWEQPDSATLVLHVRPGLKWHDGRPVTAEDVVFTFEMQKSPAIASPRQADVAAVASARATDSMTVEVKLDRTGPSTVNSILEVIPVPKHILGAMTPDKVRFSGFGQQPVGNGLYRFESWRKGQDVTVAANADAPEGRPSLDRIVVRNVPDASARLTALLSGQGDLAKIPAEQADQVRNSPGVTLGNAKRVRVGWVAFNVSKPPVDDPRVRQAFVMALDRPTLVRGMFGAEGEAALTPIPPSLREHSADVRPLAADPARAGQLLDQAGWRDSNGDGVRDKGGRPLRIEVEYATGDPVRESLLVAMQAQLKRAGIDLAPRAYERTTWVERLRGREFGASFWGWGWGPGVMGPNAEMLFHSRSIPPNGPNFAGYRNAKVDAWIDSVLVERDSTRARALWRNIEQAVTDDAVYAPVFLDPEFFGVSDRFQNVKFRGPEWWEDVIYWSIPTNRRLPRDRMGQ